MCPRLSVSAVPRLLGNQSVWLAQARRIRSIKAVVSASKGSSLSPCVVLKVERDPQAPGGVWVDLSRKRVTKPEAKACEDSYRDAKVCWLGCRLSYVAL